MRRKFADIRALETEAAAVCGKALSSDRGNVIVGFPNGGGAHGQHHIWNDFLNVCKPENTFYGWEYMFFDVRSWWSQSTANASGLEAPVTVAVGLWVTALY